ncbi:hypothetical protein M0R45_027063 [Rubus argutus]|uniref:Uncharacterized protein n=1 Tax=Rubus argutus TaxID=59490 RepID=A0AAW1X107_RUBAR
MFRRSATEPSRTKVKKINSKGKSRALLRRRSRSSASDFLHHLRALSQSQPPVRQFHLLVNPKLLSPLSRSTASVFALTRTLSYSPCLDRLGADSATQSWLLIASSTLAMRIAPIIIVERKKLKRIGKLLPKLPPPPWSPRFSGKSYIDQLSLIQKKRREIGCPSVLWILAHPIIRICFKTSSGRKVLFGLLSEQLKSQLSTLMLPIFLIGYCVPQGSLVYWVTNSLLNIVQELALNHPCVCAKLGLPDKNSSKETEL